MITFVLVLISILSTSIVAQDSAKVVCIAGQCVQGFTNLARKLLTLTITPFV